MTLFELVGKIVIQNQEALRALEETQTESRETADGVKKSNDDIEKSNNSSGVSWSKLKSKVAEYKSQGLTTSQAWSKAAREMKESTEQAEGGITGAFKKIGAAVATYLSVEAVINFGKACIEAAASVQANTAQFTAAFGDLQGSAKEMFSEISESTGILETRLQTVSTGAFSQFKGAGLNAAEALEKTGEYTYLAADAAAYYDMSLEEADSLLRSFIRGNTEAGDRIGLFTSETQRNQAALDTLGKKYIECTEAEKQMIMLDIASSIYESSGAMGQASREADGYANVTGNLKEAWKQFQAVVGGPALAAVIPILQNITSALGTMGEKLKQAQQWAQEHQTAMTVLGIALGTVTVALGAYAAAEALKNAAVAAGVATEGAATVALGAYTVAQNIATAAATAFGAVWAFITSPITLTVLAIGALIAIIVVLVKHWDTVSAACVKAWEVIKTTLSGWGEWINTNVIQPVKNFFSGLWDGICTAAQTAWDFICNAVQVGVMLVGSILTAAFQIITLPYRFIWENCKEYVFAAWEWIKNAVSTAVNAVSSVINSVLSAVASFFSTIWNACVNTVKTAWSAIKNAVTPVLDAVKNAVQTAWNWIKNVTSTTFNAVKSVASTVWNAIKSAVSGVVDSVKSKVSNVWNSIKSATSTAFNAVKSTASSIWNSIKDKITSTIESARDTVKAAIDKIKSFFNFSWSLPKLKLPHFSISGKFSLDPPSVPQISVAWYAKAMQNPMLLTEPTIFGYNPVTGQAMGGGEAGAEVVSGANTLMGMIGNVVESKTAEQNDKIVSLLAALLEAIEGGNKDLLQSLRQGQTIQLNGREFGRAVREYA